MSLMFAREKGSGKAKCKICNKIIKKGVKCIYAWGYQTNGQIHDRCPK